MDVKPGRNYFQTCPVRIKQQLVLGKTNGLLSFDKTRTAYKTTFIFLQNKESGL